LTGPVISGTFNNWTEKIPLQAHPNGSVFFFRSLSPFPLFIIASKYESDNSAGVFSLTTYLRPGRIYYKYYVDDAWQYALIMRVFSAKSELIRN
jgi:hypothetical protein